MYIDNLKQNTILNGHSTNIPHNHFAPGRMAKDSSSALRNLLRSLFDTDALWIVLVRALCSMRRVTSGSPKCPQLRSQGFVTGCTVAIR